VTPDQQLVLVFGTLHIVALGFACLLFWMFLRSETVKPWEPKDEDEDEGGGGGGGGNDRLSDPPKPPKPGGIPLPDAEQAPVRLRGPGRLADAYDAPRRPHREPERTPERV
jgi:hypothetical protein